MNPRPPIQPLRQCLPFHDSAFGWDTFEDFFCDFLNAQPIFALNENSTELRRKVIRARPFGRKGDIQLGIDLLAEMEGDEVWDFQCKHVEEWTPGQTTKAIAAYQRKAARKFLLVTCEVSEACHEVIAQHPGWALWDAREINRRFRELPNRMDAARILFTHFGPGWAEAFFGISGDGPLIGAEAKYERQLRSDGRRFHHRHALIGRESLVTQLDDFIRAPSARVFILTGRGGLGKSRLLLHWSGEFHSRHPEHTLRFISDKCADFGPSLQVSPQPFVLVFDDAHRLDDVRRALFHELPGRERIKLVLALRPGPIGQVTQELLSADFGISEIIHTEPMKSLTAEQSMALVDAALKPEFARHRQFLRNASRDCPLVTVIGAELINTGALTSGDLLDEKELQSHVFESMLADAKPVRETFGASATDDFLRLLALLGPLKLDAKFFTKAAPFIGLPHADRVSHLRDALDAAGLLHTTGAGTRITPDLLSDHLAYTACYDQAGQSRTFAERLLEHFSPEDFPKLMQHLAEAEWRALAEQPSATSVVEPLWKWFRGRFENSPFFDRSEQIKEWANIAYLQPKRSLELAELAMSLSEAPPSNHQWLIDREWNTHEHSLEWIPRMLGGVAEHHSEFVARCFDVLWQLGRDRPSGSSKSDENHPISVISDVVTYKYWKSLEIQKAALDWLERLLAGDDWQRHLHKPSWLLVKFFEPMFATSVEENWRTGRTLHYRSHPLHVLNTAPLRERILVICQTLLTRSDAHLAIQLIPVLRKGCDIARLNFAASPSKEFTNTWDVERLKSLTMLKQIVRDFSEPLVHFQVRKGLMHFLRYGNDSPAFSTPCRQLIDSIPDTLEFRTTRTVFGHDYEEFELERDVGGESNEWFKECKLRWETFVRQTADSIRKAFPRPEAWLAHLTSLDTRWRGFDNFSPYFRPLLSALAVGCPADGIVAAKILLSNPEHHFAFVFDTLAMSSTKADASKRLELIQAAAKSASEKLRAASIGCCAWWRREATLPEEAWRVIESVAPLASPLVAERVVNFVQWHNTQATERDWNLLVTLPIAPEETGLAGHIAGCAAEIIESQMVKPTADAISRLLNRFAVLTASSGSELEYALKKLADVFPVEMFLMLWQRNQSEKAGDASIKPLPYDLTQIPFPKIAASPEVKALLADFEHRLAVGEELDFAEKHLLRSAIQHGDNPSAWLEAAVSRATSENQLNALCQLGCPSEFENAALAHPAFARVLLIHAHNFGSECYQRMLARLMCVGGGRGSTNGEPDNEWKSVLEAIERLAHQHATDPYLGPLFTKMAECERASMAYEQRSFAQEIEAD